MKEVINMVCKQLWLFFIVCCILTLFIPSSHALTGYTLIKNITFNTADGWVIGNFTCNGANWAITSTECNKGECLRNNNGASASYKDCRLEDTQYKIDYTKTYLIQGWAEDEFVSNSAGWPMVGHLNTTATKHQHSGHQTESDTVAKVMNSTTQSTAALSQAVSGDTPVWFIIIMNATSNNMGIRLCTDSTCSTQLFKDWAIYQYQNYASSYLSFVTYRDANFLEVEFYTIDLSPPPVTNQTATPTLFKNLINNYYNITFNFTGNMGSKYLLYQNGTNVQNFTTKPFIRTGLLNNTKYGFKIKAYNITYTSPLSNFSNQINVTTKQYPYIGLSTSLIDLSNYNNFSYTFNYSVSEKYIPTNYNVSCYLKLNNVLNYSKTNIDIDTIPDYLNWYNVSVNFGDIEQNFNVSFLCNESNYNIEVSKSVLWKIDNIPPQLVINTSLVNNSAYIQNTTLEVEINVSDLNLFAVNRTLKFEGVVIENYFIENLTGITLYNNLSTRNLTLIGNYSFIIQAWDSHTNKEIKPYKVDNLNNGLEFEDKIKITSPDIITSKAIKQKDRYNFDIEFNKSHNFNSIFLESTENLFYLPDSKYKGHFVDFVNKKFIDFEGDYEDIVVKKINNKKYEIIIKNTKSNKILFNSIGDLNYNYETYYFSTYAGSPLPTIPLVNLTGLENQAIVLNNTFNLGLLYILFIFTIIIYLINALLFKNSMVLAITVILLAITLQIEFISASKPFFAWICFAFWVTSLFMLGEEVK